MVADDNQNPGLVGCQPKPCPSSKFVGSTCDMAANSFSMEHEGSATRFPMTVKLDRAAGEFGNGFPSGEAVPDDRVNFEAVCGRHEFQWV